MRILFVHDNYPAQFGQFGAWLAETHGWNVSFATKEGDLARRAGAENVLEYATHRENTKGVHPYVRVMERAAINGQGAARAFVQARDAGYVPDVVMAHSGWGSGMFAKDVWPEARYAAYFEWYYNSPAPDAAFLGQTESEKTRLNSHLNQRMRNAPMWSDFAAADLATVPTAFQASQFPAHLRARMTVIHDGIDTAKQRPDPEARMDVGGVDLPSGAEILTYATRGMEPHRGFPQFMTALERLQKRRPALHTVIGGLDRVSYGTRVKDGEKSWKERMLGELDLDLSRVHFTGLLNRRDFLRLLQASSVHYYATAPFVLSWSMLEAMSAGCLLVASDTAPVREFMTHGETGLLTPFHDVDAIATGIETALSLPDRGAALRETARRRIVETLDAKAIWTRRKEMLEALKAQGATGGGTAP